MLFIIMHSFFQKLPHFFGIFLIIHDDFKVVGIYPKTYIVYLGKGVMLDVDVNSKCDAQPTKEHFISNKDKLPLNLELV